MAADVEKIYKSPEGVVSKYRPRFVGDVHLPDDTYLQEHGWEIIKITLPPKTNFKLKLNRTELKQRIKELNKLFSDYDEATQIR